MVANARGRQYGAVWRNRKSRIASVPQGFVEFHLLRGPSAPGRTLYASHTVWRRRDDFEAWTRSEAFRDAHRTSSDSRELHLGHPVFEGFEVVAKLQASAPETV